MYKLTIAGAAAAALTLMGMVSAESAQSSATSSVVDLYLIGFDSDQNLVGSIIGSDSTATTYSITCGSSTTTSAARPTSTSLFDDDDGDDDDIFGDDDCGVPPHFTFTQGPSTLCYSYSYSDTETDSAYSTYAASTYAESESYVVGCVLTDSSSGVCSATDDGKDTDTTFSSAMSTSFANIKTVLTALPVTITAGAIGSSAKTASATASTSGGKSSDAKSSDAKSSGTARASGANASGVSTGGMPAVTAKAQWMIGGAAAAIAYAAM